MIEAFAEKFRAALTRREVAIRDFYDIDFGVGKLGIQPDDTELTHLVQEKLSIPGNSPIDISPARLKHLGNQLDSRLKPVLRSIDFESFDIDRAVASVATMARNLQSSPGF